jgi:hypothetical protein
MMMQRETVIIDWIVILKEEHVPEISAVGFDLPVNLFKVKMVDELSE